MEDSFQGTTDELAVVQKTKDMLESYSIQIIKLNVLRVSRFSYTGEISLVWRYRSTSGTIEIWPNGDIHGLGSFLIRIDCPNWNNSPLCIKLEELWDEHKGQSQLLLNISETHIGKYHLNGPTLQ